MKDIVLEQEELELLNEIESNEWQSIDNKDSYLEKLSQSAKYTKSLKEKKQVTIRFSIEDLIAIKAKAKKVGLGYQNLIQMLVNNYVNDKISLKI